MVTWSRQITKQKDQIHMHPIEIIRCLIISISIIIAITLLYQEKQSKIVPAPTLPWVKRKVLSLFKEFLNQGCTGKIAELGCGWGGITTSLAKQYPKAEIHGYEISYIPYLFTKIRCLRFGKRVKIYNKDIFKQDMSQYNGIFLYLSPKLISKLKPHIEKCAKDTIVVSNGFVIPDWNPIKKLETNIGVHIPIFCYKT